MASAFTMPFQQALDITPEILMMLPPI